MNSDDLDALTALEGEASAAPWHVVFANDSMCMSAVLVTKNPAVGREVHASEGSWEPHDAVAACLLQAHDDVAPDDHRYKENARLIAGMRNHLPELLRLARLGLQSSSPSADVPASKRDLESSPGRR